MAFAMAGDTSLGGPAQGFPTTRWSILVHLGAKADPAWREHLDFLAKAYWKPIYAYIRRSRSAPSEDAKDLTQQFFVHMMEGSMLEGISKSGAKFRTYVKSCLENFLRNAHRDQQRLKRGGGAVHVPIEPGSALPVPSAEATPDEALDGQWRDTVLDLAIERLKAHYERSEKSRYFTVFERYALAEKSQSRPSGREIGASMGLSEDDVHNYLKDARRRLKEMIREVISESVSTPEALEEEMAELFGPRVP